MTHPSSARAQIWKSNKHTIGWILYVPQNSIPIHLVLSHILMQHSQIIYTYPRSLREKCYSPVCLTRKYQTYMNSKNRNTLQFLCYQQKCLHFLTSLTIRSQFKSNWSSSWNIHNHRTSLSEPDSFFFVIYKGSRAEFKRTILNVYIARQS